MNRLGSESSPYLRQHADNPVDWFPWGEEAFAAARERDVPVLLSIGYSACHWCHVMAHESFEDEATAVVVNDGFVAIKVDREERPDVDAVYMDATLAMTGSGGWPMTVFLDHDGRPFYAGTYFPKTDHHGRPSFTRVLAAISEAWRDRRQELLGQAEQLTEAIRERAEVPGPAAEDDATIDASVLHGAYATLAQSFDPEWGGFGSAPKFPMPSNVELLARAYTHNRSDETLSMLTTTLDAMAEGGIYDHLGGGFARYSVDRTWTVPHFEKMLYDNAQLLRVYLHGWQLTGDARYLQVVDETIAYLLRDLRRPGGGFASAEDADSEGEEGKFYVWTLDDVRSLGGDAAVAWWGVTAEGNFEGHNILRRRRGESLLRPPEIDDARERMLAERSTRVRPGLDDKVLTEWNAMAVAALAEAGGAANRAEWVETARETATFLLDSLRRDDGRWMRSWQAGTGPRHLAYAVDHAWLVEAFVRLAEATGEPRWIAEARSAADAMLDLFWDDDAGGLFTTGHDAERLVVRQKEVHDGATPAAGSVAAAALLRLGALTGEQRYAAAGEGILRSLHTILTRQPAAVTAAVAAADMVVTGITEIVVTGDAPDLVQAARSRYLPNAVLAWGEPYDSPLWEGRRDGSRAAYVCRDYVCERPVTEVDALDALLGVPGPGDLAAAR